MLTVRVLGSFQAFVDGNPVELKGSRHRQVLARLVLARGEAVSADGLADDLWGEERPRRAAGALQTFVSELRRMVEPQRPPRTPARILVTAPAGYALRIPADGVDAWVFEREVDRARSLLDAERFAEAAAAIREALALWHGPAYGEFDRDWARNETARLNELHLLALELRAHSAIATGAAGVAVPDLEALVAEHPLREELWRLLALALYRTGRQGAALEAIRRIRAHLADELGIDPSAGLRTLEADILAQAAHLDRPSVPVVAPSAASPDAPPLVGRDLESARLLTVAEQVRAGTPRLVLVSGEAGIGKSALVERLADTLAETAHGPGWIWCRGRCPETDGAPAAWPWAELLRQLVAAGLGPDPATATRLAPLLADRPPERSDAPSDMAAMRFHLRRAVGAHLSGIAADRPLLVVLEDLHWADQETLAILTQLMRELEHCAVLIVATFRNNEVGPLLSEALARLAVAEPGRIRLTGVAESAVPDIVAAVLGRAGDPEIVASIARRSEGNPFFVRELTRLYAAQGTPPTSSEVPVGIQDVLRRRISSLPEAARTVLWAAAVVGRETDVHVLEHMCPDIDVLEAVEALLDSGLIIERDSGTLRFAHELVRDVSYGELSGLRRRHWHERAGAALRRLSPADVAALSHHYLSAGSPHVADLAVRYSRAAAELAERRMEHREAARLWEAALNVAPDNPRLRLHLEMPLARMRILSGNVTLAQRRREGALAVADEVGDPALTAELISAFYIPSTRNARRYSHRDDRFIAAVEAALANLPAERTDLRTMLLTTLASELYGEQDGRARSAAQEAVDLAREIGRPELLATALNGLASVMYWRTGLAPERAAVGAELLALSEEHDLPTTATAARLIMAGAAAVQADFAGADRHIDALNELAERYDLPMYSALTSYYPGMRAMADGRWADAEEKYRRGFERMSNAGGFWEGHERYIYDFALLCILIEQGRADGMLDLVAAYRPVVPRADIVRLSHMQALIDAGRLDEARAGVGTQLDVRDDYSVELGLVLSGRVGRALDDRVRVRHAYDRLLPAADELAGAATMYWTLGPVALELGHLAAHLGCRGKAEEHYRHAAVVADRAGSRHWSGLVASALHNLPSP